MRLSRAYVDLRLAPHWELIDPTREFLLSFFAVTLDDEEIAGQVGLAAHELMENAVKYSPTDEFRIRIEVGARGEVAVMVENRAREEHIASVIAEARATGEAEDALAYYQQKMEQSYTREDGKSCLGLARIRWEAKMSIRCQVEDGVVRLTATREAGAT